MVGFLYIAALAMIVAQVVLRKHSTSANREKIGRSICRGAIDCVLIGFAVLVLIVALLRTEFPVHVFGSWVTYFGLLAFTFSLLALVRAIVTTRNRS